MIEYTGRNKGGFTKSGKGWGAGRERDAEKRCHAANGVTWQLMDW